MSLGTGRRIGLRQNGIFNGSQPAFAGSVHRGDVEQLLFAAVVLAFRLSDGRRLDGKVVAAVGRRSRQKP